MFILRTLYYRSGNFPIGKQRPFPQGRVEPPGPLINSNGGGGCADLGQGDTNFSAAAVG